MVYMVNMICSALHDNWSVKGERSALNVQGYFSWLAIFSTRLGLESEELWLNSYIYSGT